MWILWNRKLSIICILNSIFSSWECVHHWGQLTSFFIYMTMHFEIGFMYFLVHSLRVCVQNGNSSCITWLGFPGTMSRKNGFYVVFQLKHKWNKFTMTMAWFMHIHSELVIKFKFHYSCHCNWVALCYALHYKCIKVSSESMN